MITAFGCEGLHTLTVGNGQLLTLAINILIGFGINKYSRGEWQEAIGDFKEALKMAQQLGSEQLQTQRDAEIFFSASLCLGMMEMQRCTLHLPLAALSAPPRSRHDIRIGTPEELDVFRFAKWMPIGWTAPVLGNIIVLSSILTTAQTISQRYA